MGEISAGVIDGSSFRVFGNTVHKSSRLEGKSLENNIAFDESLFNKLTKEKNKNIDKVKIEKHNLKGFGECNVYYLNVFSIKLIYIKEDNNNNKKKSFDSEKSANSLAIFPLNENEFTQSFR
jgi:hypothetical protein